MRVGISGDHLPAGARPAPGWLVRGMLIEGRGASKLVHRESGVLQEAGLLSPGCRKPGPGNGPIIV